MCLAAVMRLMIEKMIKRRGKHLFYVLWVNDGTEADRFNEIVLAQCADVVENAFIFHASRCPQLHEIVVEDCIETGRDSTLGGEAAHPDAIADQEVVEGAVQRFEEGAPIGAIVPIRDLGRGVVEPFVAPGIITGKHKVTGQHTALLQ
jgi:hypothetical protein